MPPASSPPQTAAAGTHPRLQSSPPPTRARQSSPWGGGPTAGLQWAWQLSWKRRGFQSCLFPGNLGPATRQTLILEILGSPPTVALTLKLPLQVGGHLHQE